MIGPVLGGFLNDQFHPVAIWLGGGGAGLLGALVYLVLQKIKPPEPASL